MKFKIEPIDGIQSNTLTYLTNECSFYMEPSVDKVDIEVIINKLSLVVTDGIVVHVSGFCGLDSSMKSKPSVPDYIDGILKVEYDLKHGFAYGINEKDLPVHANITTGWVCIGDPERKGAAVQFIKNCVAVVDENEQLVSLWLKPVSLPKL